jgi:hypothetical protein
MTHFCARTCAKTSPPSICILKKQSSESCTKGPRHDETGCGNPRGKELTLKVLNFAYRVYLRGSYELYNKVSVFPEQQYAKCLRREPVSRRDSNLGLLKYVYKSKAILVVTIGF